MLIEYVDRVFWIGTENYGMIFMSLKEWKLQKVQEEDAK